MILKITNDPCPLAIKSCMNQIIVLTMLKVLFLATMSPQMPPLP